MTLNRNECARRAKEQQQLIIFTNRHTRIKATLLQLKASAEGVIIFLFSTKGKDFKYMST